MDNVKEILEPACKASKPNMTPLYLTSCKNAISIEHQASDVSVAFLLVLPFSERKYCVRFNLNHIIVLYLQMFNTQNYILFKIPPSGLFFK